MGTSLVMLLIGIEFVWYATNTPQLSFPWGYTLTYLIYLVIMIGCFIIARQIK
jgi:hypothetical protein